MSKQLLLLVSFSIATTILPMEKKEAAIVQTTKIPAQSGLGCSAELGRSLDDIKKQAALYTVAHPACFGGSSHLIQGNMLPKGLTGATERYSADYP